MDKSPSDFIDEWFPRIGVVLGILAIFFLGYGAGFHNLRLCYDKATEARTAPEAPGAITERRG